MQKKENLRFFPKKKLIHVTKFFKVLYLCQFLLFSVFSLEIVNIYYIYYTSPFVSFSQIFFFDYIPCDNYCLVINSYFFFRLTFFVNFKDVFRFFSCFVTFVLSHKFFLVTVNGKITNKWRNISKKLGVGLNWICRID